MTPDSTWKNILVATDFSNSAQGALDRAKAMLQGDDTRLTLLTAVEPATHGLRIQTDDLHDRIRAEATSKLAALQSEVFDSDPRVSSRVIADYPADAICEAAAETKADLVIVGSHGAKGIKRYVLGSVAEKVVRHAPCAVLVVR